jgi:hypothetical protein
MQTQTMKRLLGARLWRFALKLERDSEDYEPLLHGVLAGFHVYRGRGQPRLLLYCTKEFLLRHWALDEAFPTTWIGVAKYGLPTPEYLEELRLHTTRYRIPLMFVGDLDPIDLTVFSVLRQNVPAHYLGIDDRWLALVDAHRHRRKPVENLMMKMKDLEREHFSIARQLLPDLERLVGPRCLAFLESGAKLELEGACNPAFHSKKFLTLLARHLHRKALRLIAR